MSYLVTSKAQKQDQNNTEERRRRAKRKEQRSSSDLFVFDTKFNKENDLASVFC